eukprot:TRINITY_DN1423_c0_g1_i1.p1 TRINITY_DN1423_c0_g1~~TRINITY_DN1423_c0_g1_i1.p1  ORF type:complete len:191 (-),score=25.23 TRINITY_DN1423_c0_g1_i1:3-575(-)
MSRKAGGEVSTHKIVVFGSIGVGKTSLCHSFLQLRHAYDYDPTIEDSYRKQMFIEGGMVNLDIQDTGDCTDEATALRDHYSLNGEGFLFVYSVNSRSSFEMVQTLKEYVDSVRIKMPSMAFVLVANKVDLLEFEVLPSEGQTWAANHGCKFFQTSVKTNTNVSECFIELIRELRVMKGEIIKKKKGCIIL